LVNVLADFVILFLTAKSAGGQVKPLRLLGGALLGGAYAVGYVYYYGHWAFQTGGQFLFSWFMLYVAVRPSGFQAWKTAGLIFYLLNFLTAGIFLGLRYSAAGKPFFYAVLLLGTFLLAVLLVSCLRRHLAGIWLQMTKLTVEIRLLEQWYVGTGFVDTGNGLRDPLGQRPVIVAEAEVMQALLAAELNWHDALAVCQALEEPWAERVRLIPYSSVGKKNGLLVGMRCDDVVLTTYTGKTRWRDIVVAITPEPLGGGEYHCLIPASFLEKPLL
jgi:stage II sporulation protein GA (sporulation sigma-E factor processing peptidase)